MAVQQGGINTYEKETDFTHASACHGGYNDAHTAAVCSCWFLNCNALKGITGMENLNTSEVTDMVTDMSEMFDKCKALTTIYCNDECIGKLKKISDI
ncbi:hypothetical protein [Prevotella koreensis]|uniref:hypothetical protein n=1 Tax=Prevotella koreensis TaxID=2490854 RepID=UPI0028E3915A|nr:hypothetical protein [Prevotella koreensis]